MRTGEKRQTTHPRRRARRERALERREQQLARGYYITFNWTSRTDQRCYIDTEAAQREIDNLRVKLGK